jgi:general secretion pathway protein A
VESPGFVVIDSNYRLVYANNESVRILAYPSIAPSREAVDAILTQKICSILPGDFEICGSANNLQFQSGRRLYHCRAYVVEDQWSGQSGNTRIALIMERGMKGYSRAFLPGRLPAGMREDPFSFTPDPKYYYRSRGHNEVFASLRGMILERRGVGVVLGQAGIGKTLLIEALKESLERDSDFASFPGSFKNRAELIRSTMAILGIQGIGRDPEENLDHFEEWLISRRRAGRTVVLLCDDAHEIDAETLQNLCRLSELEEGHQKLLQIVMAGRQNLLSKLSESGLDSDCKTINLICRLMPLGHSEVPSYVSHRLRIAGCGRPLFSAAALSGIALYSRGIPLNVHAICRHCLSLAASAGVPTVDDRMVDDSAYDLVLKSQPAEASDDSAAQRNRRLPRDRRGLRLVEKR